MNLFNKNYHMKIYMPKSQLEKNNKQKSQVQEGFYRKTIGEYMCIYIYVCVWGRWPKFLYWALSPI